MESNPVVIEPRTQAEIVQNLRDKVRTNYIFPEIAGQICARLQQHLDNHEYDDLVEGDFFAYALTQHLQEVNQDEHLWVRWHAAPLPDQEELLRKNQAWREEQQQEARLDNYGFHKVERLDGNIGYLDIRYFHRPQWGGDVAAAAMSLVANANALIIDLRGCLGGYPGMIALICSYLFGEEPVHLDSIYWKDEDITQQYWTLPFIPGRRFGDKPVYVLTSKVTFSGGEGFAYILQTRQRATVVGEKTDGGAHATTTYRLHPHFEVSIPIGSTINPVTRGNWEKTGIIPDICVPQTQALQVAYRAALQAVIDSLSKPVCAPLERLRQEAEQALCKNVEP
jgi:hypothetical protein